MPEKKPNIVFIMGDDIGWFNIGAYHQGLMSGRRRTSIGSRPRACASRTTTPRRAARRAARTSSPARCRSAPGSPPWVRPARRSACRQRRRRSPRRCASMGYATGQFGKNHLGDRNEYLPTVHGFDEFFGYLYHLDAMEDPAHPNYPQELKDTVGPRNMLHCWASDKDDTTVQPRWGKVGKQKIEDAGTLYPEAHGDGRRRDPRPHVQVHRQGQEATASRSSSGSTRRACTSSRTSRTSTRSCATPENGWGVYEAGMAQLDDIVGAVMKKLKDAGIENDTILVFSTDNGAENFTWPDGGQTPFAGGKGTVLEGGFRVALRSCAGRARFPPARSRTA